VQRSASESAIDKPMELFLSSIRSERTREGYILYFKRYQKFIGIDTDPFFGNDVKAIQDKIIEFVVDMKAQGKGYSTIHNYASAVLAFYKINDVILNVTKINRFIPPARRVRNDRSYDHDELLKLIETADERARVMILLMASAGLRQGAIPSLKIRHLQDRKLIVYENEPEQYFTFITPECKKAIDSYMDMRKRYGEILTPESYLVREQFDVRDQFHISKARPITTAGIKWKMIDIAKRAGVRSKDVKASHSFRKFFTTQLINSKVNPEIREMLLGHSIGLTGAYYKPTEQEMFEEYEKALDNLTIDPTQKLKREIVQYKSKYENMSSEVEAKILKRLEEKGIKL
jgi:integrase